MVKRKGLYQNTPTTQTFLVEGSSTFLGEFLATQLQWHKPVLEDLSTLVRNGPPQTLPSEIDAESEDLWAQTAVLMANYERSGTAQQVAKVVSELPEFPSFRKMLDLGGGPGLLGIAIVAAHPRMKGVVLDRPAVAKVAEKFIKEYELEDRMEALGGDYRTDHLGGAYNLILASATLNFVKDDLDAFLRRVYDALNPGGVFVAISDGLTDERTKPELMVTSWLSMGLTGQEMGFEQGFVADSMLRVGFKSVRSRTLEMPKGLMDFDVGRKGKEGGGNKNV